MQTTTHTTTKKTTHRPGAGKAAPACHGRINVARETTNRETAVTVLAMGGERGGVASRDTMQVPQLTPERQPHEILTRTIDTCVACAHARSRPLAPCTRRCEGTVGCQKSRDRPITGRLWNGIRESQPIEGIRQNSTRRVGSNNGHHGRSDTFRLIDSPAHACPSTARRISFSSSNTACQGCQIRVGRSRSTNKYVSQDPGPRCTSRHCVRRVLVVLRIRNPLGQEPKSPGETNNLKEDTKRLLPTGNRLGQNATTKVHQIERYTKAAQYAIGDQESGHVLGPLTCYVFGSCLRSVYVGGVASQVYDGVLTPTTTERQPHEELTRHRNSFLYTRGVGGGKDRHGRCRHFQPPVCQLLAADRERGASIPSSRGRHHPNRHPAGRTRRVVSGKRTQRQFQELRGIHRQESSSGRWQPITRQSSRPLPCYSFSSCLRSVCDGWGQFWPIFMPVVRAHFLAGDQPATQLMDGFAVFCRDGLFPRHPIRHNGLGNAQGSGYGNRPSALPIHPIFEIHSQIISHGVSICQ